MKYREIRWFRGEGYYEVFGALNDRIYLERSRHPKLEVEKYLDAGWKFGGYYETGRAQVWIVTGHVEDLKGYTQK